MITRFLNSKTKTVASAAGILAVSAFFSQLLGLFRNNLLSTSLPAEQTDIYFAAFRVPDLVYGILITGGIVAAFLPVFAVQFRKNKEEAQRLMNNVLFVFLFALVFICSILAILAPYFINLLVPGFSPAQKTLTVNLTRIMFLSPILLGLSAIFSGVLHYFNLFFAYSLAPVLYNVGIITGILFFYPSLGLTGLAWGVILGALLHLLVQLPPVFKYGFKPAFCFDLTMPSLRKILRLMLPRTLGSASYHLNLIVITAIASTISIGAISIFNYANYLYGIPISLIGISFATVAFPLLSKNIAQKENKQFKQNFFSIFKQILFLASPITLLMFFFRAQLVRIVYGASLGSINFFGWQETRLTAACVGIFALSLFAACFIPFLARVFFSLHDTKKPVQIAVLAMFLNIVLSLLFVFYLKFDNPFQQIITNFLKLNSIKDIAIIGLPLALTISSIVQFVLLLYFLKRKLKNFSFSPLSGNVWKIVLSSILVAPVSWFSLRVFNCFLNTSKVLGILAQLLFSALISILIYLLITLALGCQEPKKIWSAFKRQFQN